MVVKEKVFLSEHVHRITAGPPKHVLHLFWSAFVLVLFVLILLFYTSGKVSIISNCRTRADITSLVLSLIQEKFSLENSTVPGTGCT